MHIPCREGISTGMLKVLIEILEEGEGAQKQETPQ
jgi:hypothetical protein